MTELFAVHDAVADRWLEPFSGPTIEFGIRGFKEACETDGHQFMKHAEDYSLWHIGTFDEALGVLEGFTARKVAMASSFTNYSLQFDGPQTVQGLRDSVSEREA